MPSSAKPLARAAAALLILTALAGGRRMLAADQDLQPAIRITSPLGRTGVVTRLRIVAQVTIPAGQAISAVSFYVDGALIGTAPAGPYSAVDWLDQNPFERREIIVEAADAAGRVLKDTVVLPPFEVNDKTEVTSILLETGVYDKAGRFISSLDPSVFAVHENDVAQKIDLVARETLATHMVLLVDNSQSMSRTMDFVRLAAERLAGALRKRDTVIVAPFNVHIGTITGPTNDAPTIAQAIGAMHAAGGTAFLDSLRESTHLLEGMDGRRAIILITDGYDENSKSTIADVIREAEAANVTIYIVGIGGVAGISLRGEDALRRVANETGGRIFFPPREPDLVAIADSVATDAHSRYLITYTPANQKKDGAWRAITVDVPDGYRVRTRAGYFAPSPPPIRPALEFTVTDDAHAFVDITADDLEVVEDGVVQKVDTFQEAVDPVSIVMALDSSGSMKKSAAAVQEAARDFVIAVRPEDSLALITFADVPKFAHVLATNRQWSLDAIDKYAPLGGTALYDALFNSLMTLKGVAGRHAVVVLTDGKDENNPGTAPGSEHTLDEVLKLVKSVNATVFPIGLGTKVERPVLERLAAVSGGEALFPTDVTLLDAQYHRVIENLRRRYVLSYTSTNSLHDGSWRSVEIRSRTRDLVVATLGGYFAPGE
ncbi:MAG TPA: VWA domain-containing protein [Vicinamibacterales bacterium]|nr:VWA domain-containing protein [Vicinamibacterales bacterium]